jgi:hypothetical protein
VGELDAEGRALYTQLPPGAEMRRIAALARQITAGARSDAARAEQIQAWLRDSGEFEYSLEQPDVRGRDPLTVFLFDARRGHCEYYSTAMAVMLRTLDVPTRNVTGFLGGRYNPYGDYYAIRNGDAHSWLEAHVDGRWVTYDPTPPGRGPAGLTDDWLTDVRAIVDALRTRWTRHIVSYDLRAQAEAMRTAFRFLRSLRTQSVDEPASAEADAGGSEWSWSELVAATLAVAVLGLAVVVARRRRRSRAGAPPPSTSVRHAVQLYRELERAMRRRGVPRPPHETPREHAERLEREGFEAAAAVADVTRHYMAARYGSEEIEPVEMARLRARIGEVRRAARR